MHADPTIQDLQSAQDAFEANEPRDQFYRVATELVDLALRGATSLTVAEALAVLLRTWNAAYYRFRALDSQHFSEIEHLISSRRQVLAALRQGHIETLSHNDKATIVDIFGRFEGVLGPVGAAKCLHLLAPYFSPLWDRAIASAYGLAMNTWGRNAEDYWQFARITKEQAVHLGGEQTVGRNPLKAIDEYNYCGYTRRWI